MIREGQPDAALTFLSPNPKQIAPSNFSEGKALGKNWQETPFIDQCYSASTGKQYPTICRISYDAREGIRRHQDRLCAERPRAFEAVDCGQRSSTGDGIRTETDSSVAAL